MDKDVLQGYKKEERVVNQNKINVLYLFVFITVAPVYIVSFYAIWGRDGYLETMKGYFDGNVLYTVLFFFLMLMVGFVLYEFVRSVIYAVFAKRGFRSIKFRALKKVLAPCCLCTEPLTRKQYAVSMVMPFVIVGFLPVLAAFATGILPLVIFAMILTTVATGDFIVLRSVLKEDLGCVFLDHPTNPGYYVFVKK